jgi:hypothetical protein
VVGRTNCNSHENGDHGYSYRYACEPSPGNNAPPIMRVEYYAYDKDCAGNATYSWYYPRTDCDYGQQVDCVKKDGPAGFIKKHDGLMT